jgi:monovalent cation/hydrogen antiporter
VENVELFICLLAGVVVLVWLAGPLRIPHPVLLVVGGLAFGLIPFVPEVQVDPEAVLLIFLPPILYAAAFEFADEDMRMKWPPIALMAVPLVLVTIGVVAWVAHQVIGLPWEAAFVLGAVLGPTDPVSATSVVRRLGGSERTATLLEGESLVNDGTAITAFRIAVGVAGGEALNPGSAALEFVGVAAGGVALGAALGWVGAQLRRRLDAPRLEITMALVTAYGAFAAAERLHVSGILATVAAGFVVGRAGGLFSPHSRMQTIGFWSALSFLAESLLFLLVGLAFAGVAGDAGDGLAPVAGQSLLLGAAIIGLRLLWMYTVPYAMRSGPLTDKRERLLMGVSGMRGAVSVAAALAIPSDLAGRDDIILLTCGVVLITLVPAGLALPWLVRSLGLVQSDEAQRRYVQARQRIAHAALERAEDIAASDDAPEALLARAREAYELRIARLEQSLPDREHVHAGAAERYRRLRQDLLEAEQQALEELRDAHEVRGDTLREVQRDLDLEATRLER